MQLREFLISDIQDNLSSNFNFYMTKESYLQDDKLLRIIKRFEFMFNSFIRNNIFLVRM